MFDRTRKIDATGSDVTFIYFWKYHNATGISGDDVYINEDHNTPMSRRWEAV